MRYPTAEGVYQGRTNLERVKILWEKVWFISLDTREVYGFGHASRGGPWSLDNLVAGRAGGTPAIKAVVECQRGWAPHSQACCGTGGGSGRRNPGIQRQFLFFSALLGVSLGMGLRKIIPGWGCKIGEELHDLASTRGWSRAPLNIFTTAPKLLIRLEIEIMGQTLCSVSLQRSLAGKCNIRLIVKEKCLKETHLWSQSMYLLKGAFGAGKQLKSLTGTHCLTFGC